MKHWSPPAARAKLARSHRAPGYGSRDGPSFSLRSKERLARQELPPDARFFIAQSSPPRRTPSYSLPLMRLSELPQQLDRLRADSLLREPDDTLTREQMRVSFGKRFLDAASNDYLDLASHETDPSDLVSRETSLASRSSDEENVSRETASIPTGARASRLVFGTHEQHLLLEHEVAEWLEYQAALLFSSGYAANLGALGALLSKEDAVFSDQLNHASLIDGIRLSGAKAQVFEHLNLDALELQLQQSAPARVRWIVCESYYSMDGDGPDLRRLDELAKKYDAQLYVDEAHAVGTFGPKGRGLCAAAGVVPDVLMVAFGKSFGAQGACVLGSELVRTWLWNRARSFVFSTAPSPVLAQSIRGRLLMVRAAEVERNHLEKMSLLFREKLRASGIALNEDAFGPIVSLILNSAEAALAAADALRSEGILAQAIRPPTVPNGRSRLRLVLRVAMGEAQIRALAEALIRVQAASSIN